jgi:choline-sulfatase
MNSKISFSLFLAGNTLLAAAQQTKPNILYIMTDQQSYKMLSCAGDKYLKTPAMDKIAANGYRFNKAYCVNPVSVPSRFALLTGHYGSEIGVRNNEAIPDREKLKPILEQSALGKIFREGGYETLYGGKTHLPLAYVQGDIETRMDKNYGFNYFCKDDGMELAQKSAELLKNRKKTDKPLFMFVSLMNPHDINYFWKESILAATEKPTKMSNREWTCSKGLMSRFNSLPDSEYKKEIPEFPINFAPVNDEPYMDGLQKFTDKNRLNFYSWCYHRLTETVDNEINVVLTALQQSGIADNTIIVFTSDHGDMNGSHELIMKSRFYEESTRIPFIFSGPGILKGVVDDKTLACNGLDLLPTLCDFAHIKEPFGLSGVSLKPVMTGKSTPIDRKYLFTESTVGYMVLDGRYKYALYDGPGNNVLFTDTKSDPYETRNLVNDTHLKDIKARLDVELLRWMKSRNLALDPTVTKFNRERKKQINTSEFKNREQMHPLK